MRRRRPSGARALLALRLRRQPIGWRGRSGVELPADDLDELGRRAPEIVVYDDVAELTLLGELLARQLEPFADLTSALRGALSQPPLELVEGRRLDEDRHAAGHLV